MADNSAAARLARLQASGQGDSLAAQNLQKQISTTQSTPAPTPVTPTSVVPTTPIAPTPAPTQSFAEQSQGMSVAERQALRAQTPTASVPDATPPTPVTPTTLTQTPVVPTETKPPVKPTEPVINYNTSVGREKDIQKNVSEITATNPNLLKDRNAFNQAFGYDTADQGKKALLDSAFQGANQPMNQKDVLNAFISGVSVPEQNTQAYRNAKVQYDTFKKFNAMTPTQLLDNLKQGQIGTEMDALLSQNPGYIEAKQKLAQVQRTASLNRMGQSAIGVINGKEPEDLSDLSKVEAKYNAPPGTNVQAYEQYVTNNEDVKTAGTTLHNIATQISEVTKTYNEALKSLKAQYGDMPASALLTLMSTRTQDTKSLLDSLIDAKTLAQGDFDIAMKMAEGSYGAYTKDLAVQQGIESEQRQMKNSLALSQMEYDQKIKQQVQAMNDPTTAIKSVMDEYKKLGIPFTSTVQSRLAEFKASGKPLEQFLTEMSQNIQQSPAYKAYAAKKAGEGISYQTIGNKVYKIGADGSITETNISTGADESKWGVIGKNADGSDKYGFINTATSTVTPYIAPTGEATGDLRYLANQYPGQAWAKNNNPAGITWNSNFDKGTGTAKLFADAGIKFEKGTARPANEGGNYVTFATIEDGLKAQQILMTQTYGNSTVGQMLSSWVGTSEGPNYAKQVAGMAGITDLNQKVSALSPEQVSKLQMAKIQKESPGLAKLLTQPSTTPTNANQYTDQNVNDLAYLTELQEKNPTQAAKDMKELGYTARDLANYKAGNVPLTEKQKTTSTDIISSITDLVTNYDWNDAVGKFDYTRLIGTQDAEDTNVAINNLVAKLTLPNLGVLKGPMSDKDIQFIKEASSKLSTTQSNSSFERNLIDAYNLAARRAGKPEIKKLSDISAGTQSSTVGGELDYSKYE